MTLRRQRSRRILSVLPVVNRWLHPFNPGCTPSLWNVFSHLYTRPLASFRRRGRIRRIVLVPSIAVMRVRSCVPGKARITSANRREAQTSDNQCVVSRLSRVQEENFRLVPSDSSTLRAQSAHIHSYLQLISHESMNEDGWTKCWNKKCLTKEAQIWETPWIFWKWKWTMKTSNGDNSLLI